jgi:tetratricopeptide (TPR) repeat protein
MRKWFCILVLLIISNSVFCEPNNNTLDELRSKYITALRDYLNAPKVYESFLKVEKPDGKILAYQGALEAIMTKTTWNLFKMSYLNKSEASFNKAIEMAPDDIEIRHMRLAVQFEIPSYLGFSDDMEDDKEFILNNMNNLNSETIPLTLKKQIIDFMHPCEMFTVEQIQKIELTLASTS